MIHAGFDQNSFEEWLLFICLSQVYLTNSQKLIFFDSILTWRWKVPICKRGLKHVGCSHVGLHYKQTNKRKIKFRNSFFYHLPLDDHLYHQKTPWFPGDFIKKLMNNCQLWNIPQPHLPEVVRSPYLPYQQRLPFCNGQKSTMKLFFFDGCVFVTLVNHCKQAIENMSCHEAILRILDSWWCVDKSGRTFARCMWGNS